MRQFLILQLLLLCATLQAQPTKTSAQTTPHPPRTSHSEYVFPLSGAQELYSANFGEIRPGHFHAGIDFKTDGRTGLPIVAVADGYISRITVTPGGYGRALYLTLDKGKTAVYGHLECFNKNIEKLVHTERNRLQSNSVDLYFTPKQYPVRRGEHIALSGNSGSSFGPHLHYELRDTPTQRYLNIVKQGIIAPADKLPPRIMKIHYVEVDSVQGVCMTAPMESYTVVRSSSGKYRLTRNEAIDTGRKGYFVAELTDRRDGVNNTFGIWRLTAWIDDQMFCEYRMDNLLPEHSRFSDAVSCYPLQNNSRNEVIRLAQMSSVPSCFYPSIKERGIIHTAPNQVRRIRLEAEDDRGNISQMEFSIKGRTEEFRATPTPGSIVVKPEREAQVGKVAEISAEIPAGALFEAAFCHPEQLDRPVQAASGVVLLSPLYRIFDSLTPLRRTARISIHTSAPGRLLLRAVLARRTPQGTLTYIGGRYANDAVTANTRILGEMLAVADTLPPQIRHPFADSTNLSKTATLQMHISDNFSGIASYGLYINDKWVPCEYFPIQGVLSHTFDTATKDRFHSLRLSVTDGCGNMTKWDTIFYR